MKNFIIWNLFVFALYGIDKYKAKHGGFRIGENSLLFAAFFLGGIGAFLAMQLLRHKVRRKKFVIGVPIAILCNFITIRILKMTGLV